MHLLRSIASAQRLEPTIACYKITKILISQVIFIFLIHRPVIYCTTARPMLRMQYVIN